MLILLIKQLKQAPVRFIIRVFIICFMKNRITFDFMEKSEMLFKWSGRLIKED